jgi:hypothetical protein
MRRETQETEGAGEMRWVMHLWIMARRREICVGRQLTEGAGEMRQVMHLLIMARRREMRWVTHLMRHLDKVGR